MLDILYVSPERFRGSPQIGTACRMAWEDLGRWLARPSVGEAKDEAGAWSPALYRDNVRRKANLVAIGALVVDVDEAGDVDAAVDLVARYRAIVHETFSSTKDSPRCRIVLDLVEPVDAATYEATHRIVRSHLKAAGLPADEGAKDASRVSYAPVRRLGAGYRFRMVDGAAVDARAVLAAQPPPPPRAAARPVTSDHRDAYVRGALRRAAEAVGAANEGIRHYTLAKEAFGLARLELSLYEVESALLPAFVAAAGGRRANEGARTIRDAIRARRGSA